MTAFALLISAFVAAIASSASDIDDKKIIVGDLDTQYQLAVKNNDAKTMDRILADDFVLVTGRECKQRGVLALHVEVGPDNGPANALYRRFELVPRRDRRQVLTVNFE